jgi:hypothetical protein
MSARRGSMVKEIFICRVSVSARSAKARRSDGRVMGMDRRSRSASGRAAGDPTGTGSASVLPACRGGRGRNRNSRSQAAYRLGSSGWVCIGRLMV